MALLSSSTPSITSILLPTKCFVTSKNFTHAFVSNKKLSLLLNKSYPSLQLHCSNVNSTSPIDPLPLQSPQLVLFIKGLPLSTTEGHLKKTFMQFGELSQVKIVVDKNTKQSLGYAFVWFENEKSAQLALKEMDGKFFDGRFISVKFAKPGSCKPTSKETPPFKF